MSFKPEVIADSIRSYRHSPGRIYVQVRVPSSTGRTLRYAGASLPFDKARKLAKHILSEIGEA